MDKFAAIDLGTNTFHLLIASFTTEGHLIEHYRKRAYIHLAAEGIHTIGGEPFNRAIECIKDFSKILNMHELKAISCSGTAAMRTASNGPVLVKAIFDISGVKVDVIDGITEAKYIYEGISLAIPEIKDGSHLLMDIGGGSVEFVVIKDGHYLWSDSYPIGIAILKRAFHKSEPIGRDEILLINQFIRDKVGKLLYICRRIEFKSLVGASGSFEVLSELALADQAALYSDVPLELFLNSYEGLILQTFEERLARPDIPNDRAALIVVAFQLIKYILSQIKCAKIQVSKYAMKEGMLVALKSKH